MKNLLSENMMRFGTKNLSEAAQKELVVKSIMETINQHGLQNVIRKKLKEAAPDPKYLGYAQKILGQLMTALGGRDDEQGVLTALQSIAKYGGQPVYDNLLQLVKTSKNVKAQFGYNFNRVSSMIKNGGISKSAYDGTQSSSVSNPIAGLGMGWIDEEWTRKYADILRKYNPDDDDFTA